MDDFARAVEDGLKLSKRLVLPGGLPPPRPPTGMDRTVSSASAAGPDARLLPTAPTAYAVVTDPGAVDTPDVPSYQPYVYGRLDPSALIPLQMKEVDLAVDCALDAAHVTLRARWWLHCITRSRDCDVRLVVPMGEQGSILGAEVTIGRRSYNTQVIEVEDHTVLNHVNIESGALLKPQLFFLTIPQVEGGADIYATFRWTQKLLYDKGRFSVDIPFRFPYFVNPLPKVFMKREKIQLTLNSGFSKEVLLQETSHPLKEKARQGDKLSFLHEAVVENWSSKDFNFSYSVYSADLSGGVLVQPSTLRDYDDRDSFCVFLLPGSGNRKVTLFSFPRELLVFRKAVVFIVDTSGSMQGKPLENVKQAVSTALSELMQGDYFNIITFNDELHSFSSCLEQVSEKTIASATDWMSSKFVAEGGTDIMHPLSEVDSDYIPDISAKSPLCVSGKYHGKFPDTVIAKGYLADMKEISIELKVQHLKEIPLDKVRCSIFVDCVRDFSTWMCPALFELNLTTSGLLVPSQSSSHIMLMRPSISMHVFQVLATQQISLLTSKAWHSADKQLERKVGCESDK
ncbi:hypothetical protein BAE44_0017080 [Dichanthelium oligosanthes]|uniref:VWFA domain-containing protein n=1 Tax=Dichanthelium oligosanthes TaxID=888268 RepID=A0A1E5V9W5_9POAL|nr:hypothetical protein BAE44_0017080 [Dichanthelium oligosanthes]